MPSEPVKTELVFATRDLLPLNILLHCRTVVESPNFVSTGVMTHMEGELFEIELSDFDRFELGDPVKLTVYSPAGIQSFPSRVFAKYDGAIALIQPPQISKMFQEKREHPRVEVNGSARIGELVKPDGKTVTLEEPLEVPLKNISVTGIAFQAPDRPEFDKWAKFKARMALGFEFDCEIEIVRRERLDDGYVCGAIMTLLEPDMMRPLRALILRQQVERNVQNRREKGAEKRRTFKE